MTEMNILDLFLKASLLVKLIMLILVCFSIASWAIIIQRTRILNSASREAEAFEDKFWSGIELSRLYQESQGRRDNLTGSEQIFYSGFKEFARLHRANSHAPEAIVEGASRAMRISMNRELETPKPTSRSSVRWVLSAHILVCLVPYGGLCMPLSRWAR